MLGTLSGLNPWVQLICSLLLITGMVWGVVWGGIKVWHRQAARTLEEKFEEKFKPYFDKLNDRLDTQDETLKTVEHEVSLNSGTSVKDGVREVQREIKAQSVTQKEILAEQRLARELQGVTNERIGGLRTDLSSHLSYHEGVEDGKRQRPTPS